MRNSLFVQNLWGLEWTLNARSWLGRLSTRLTSLHGYQTSRWGGQHIHANMFLSFSQRGQRIRLTRFCIWVSGPLEDPLWREIGFVGVEYLEYMLRLRSVRCLCGFEMGTAGSETGLRWHLQICGGPLWWWKCRFPFSLYHVIIPPTLSRGRHDRVCFCSSCLLPSYQKSWKCGGIYWKRFSRSINHRSWQCLVFLCDKRKWCQYPIFVDDKFPRLVDFEIGLWCSSNFAYLGWCSSTRCLGTRCCTSGTYLWYKCLLSQY